MTEEYGVPARELSDSELEREGVHAHATRHWVFLHGTAEQFRTHTQRMLELEQEYLRRHPQRTWQGSGGADASVAAALARDDRIRDLVRTLTSEVFHLLEQTTPSRAAETGGGAGAEAAISQLLAAFAAAPNGTLHKLEAHHRARGVAPNARLVASLYKHDPPLLQVKGDLRVITPAGRAYLAEHPVPATGTGTGGAQ